MRNIDIMNPIVFQRADPFIYLHTDGYYYMTASIPAYDAIEIRRAKEIEELENGECKIIWKKHPSGELSSLIWAPEIHYINNKWYIYFAAAPDDKIHLEHKTFNHRMFVIENKNNDPFLGDWEEKGKIKTHLESFSLDATVMNYEDKLYYIWAQKDPAILGNSNIYISLMKNPWEIEGEIELLTTPEFEWEKRGFLVNEGPGILKNDKYIYLTYSASATDENYCVGVLKLEKGANPLKKYNWKKNSSPIFESDIANIRFGPGHNSFTKTKDGRDVVVYHCRDYNSFDCDPLYDPNRHTCIQIVEWNERDEPVLGKPLPLKRGMK